MNQAVAYLAHEYATTDGATDRIFGDRVLLSPGYANSGTPGRVYQFMGTAADGLGRDLGTEDYADQGYADDRLGPQTLLQIHQDFRQFADRSFAQTCGGTRLFVEKLLKDLNLPYQFAFLPAFFQAFLPRAV